MLWILLLPVATIVTGAASNQAVLIANGDKFPVMVNPVKLDYFGKEHANDEAKAKPSPNQEEPKRSTSLVTLPDGTVMIDDVHCWMSKKTHLNFMADIFDFRSEGIESIGDMGIEFGNWMWIYAPYIWGCAIISKLWRLRNVNATDRNTA